MLEEENLENLTITEKQEQRDKNHTDEQVIVCWHQPANKNIHANKLDSAYNQKINSRAGVQTSTK